jgi:hypothetical protein
MDTSKRTINDKAPMPIQPAKVVENDWVTKELEGLELGDKRLEARAESSLRKMSRQPKASLPQGLGDWASTKAAYALFGQEGVTREKILAPHIESTWERAEEYNVVLALQDTSFLDFTHYAKMEGLGPIGTEKQKIRGVVLHDTLLVTPEGLPLGMVDQQAWVRSEHEVEMTRDEKRKRPIEEKESYKWLKSVQQVQASSPDDTQVVHVCDAEGDIYELMAEAEEVGAKYLIRAGQDRAILEPEVGKLKKSIENRAVRTEWTVKVSARKEEPAREAKVNLRYGKVTIKEPQLKKEGKKRLARIVVYAVLVSEINVPEGMTPVEWLLLTNVPVKNLTDALERIRWYCLRWQIEIHFKILKSGCRIEHRHLKNFSRLGPCLALYTMIAWRLHWLTHMNRIDPEAPCTEVLSESEWKALYTLATHSTTVPDNAPSVAQVVLWIAQLGGFLNRKSDGKPGVTVLWKGWQRFQDSLSMWLILNSS